MNTGEVPEEKNIRAVEEYAPSVRERWNNRAVFRLIWPLMIEQILGVTIGLVDTMMMTAVGEYAISGVALVDAIATLFIIAFGALATGGAVVISQYLGRGDLKNANSAANQLIYVSVIVSSLIMLVAIVSRTFMLKLIYGDIDADVLSAARTYFLFGALSYPALAIYNAAAALFRSMGNSKVTMIVSLLINVVHIILNFLFIYGFGLGVGGAALSTLACRILGGILLIFFLVKGIRGRKEAISLDGIEKPFLDGALIRNILKVGIPSGIETSLFQFGKILVSRIAVTFGTAAIAANAVTNTITSLAFMPGNAFSLAILTIVGQCVGALDFKSARFLARRIMITTYIVICALCAVTYILIEPIVGLFSLGNEAHDLTVRFMNFIYIMMALFWPGAFTMPNALRAAGDVRYVMVVSVTSMWLVRVIGAYMFTYYMGAGAIGIWYAWVADWIVRSVFFIVRWIRGKWEIKRILG